MNPLIEVPVPTLAMRDFRYAAIGATLKTISFLKLDRLAGKRFGGAGVVLAFHQVRPKTDRRTDQNALLEITPEFLDTVLRTLNEQGFDIIPIEEMSARLTSPGHSRRFAVLTFDDGFIDNHEFALPVLRKHHAPMTLNVCPGFLDRTTPIWWLDLEDAIWAQDKLAVDLPDGTFAANTGSEAEKRTAFKALYWRLRDLEEPVLRQIVATLAVKSGIDSLGRVDRLCMNWTQLREFARDPLVTIGAHTITHPRLGTISTEAAAHEMSESKRRIEAEIGKPVRHFAYPVGDPVAAGHREFELAKAAGFHTAVTTRPGMICPGHCDHLHALPRLSVNGLFQQAAYFKVLLSGVPFYLKNKGKLINVD